MTEQTIPMPAVTNKEFIDAVFRSLPEGAHVYGCSFKEPTGKSNAGLVSYE
jgi:hypothetical protein